VAFAGGITGGIATALALLYNGLLLGVIGGLMGQAGNGVGFIDLVTAHGVLELSCILVGGAAGLSLGWSIISPGLRTRRDSLQREAVEALLLVLGTAPWLVIAGIVHDQRYFDDEVAPHIDDEHVRYIGPVGAAERSPLLGGARALLHLIDFDEPFGLSVVEAMACGTPVIAFRRGSMPELIDEGVTGMIVDDVEMASRAVARVGQLDRTAIRTTAVRRFSQDRMISDYESVYEHILSRPH